MRYAFMMLFVLISGCVLNQPQNFVIYNEYHSSNTSNVSSTDTRTTKETPATKPITVVVKIPPAEVKTKCALFVLPEAVAIPVKPIFTNPDLRTKTDLDIILVSHIKTLEGHARAQRAAIEDAYKEWLKSCK